MIKYPEINVKLVGEDGNAFFILARCATEMKKGGLDKDEMDTFQREATSGNYNKLLRTVMEWFTCDEDEDEE